MATDAVADEACEGTIVQLLCRINDKNAAIGYPYYFNELTRLGRGNSGSDETTTCFWRQLRDVLVYAEDTSIRALDPKDRWKLKIAEQSELLESLHWYSKTLQCMKSESGEFIAPELQSSATKKALQSLERCVAEPLRSTWGALSDPAVAITALSVVNVLLSFAVRCVAVEDVGASLLSDAHQKWVADHRRRLVTCTTTAVDAAKPTAKTAASTSEVALVQALKAVYEARGVPMPLSVSEAHNETMRMLRGTSVPSPSGADNATERALQLLSSIPIAKTNMQVSEGDPTKKRPKSAKEGDVQILEQATSALRLLFTQDLRTLQEKINMHIALAQDLTATCKTDPRLGRVGT